VTDETPNPNAPEPGPAPRRPLPTGPALPPPTNRPDASADIRPRRPEYKGDELDPERGPGLGCFWFQMAVLGFFIVLIPIGLKLNWPFELLAILLFVVIGLLLLTGQTIIFLLRLVAADRRTQGRRRPLASTTKTVGELEDEQPAAPVATPDAPEGGAADVVAAIDGVAPAVEAAPSGDLTSAVPEAAPPEEAAPPGEAAPATGTADDATDDTTDVGTTGAGAPDAGTADDTTDLAAPPEEAAPDAGTADVAASVDAADAPPADAPEDPDPGVRQ
jgi:hypothetical protein